MGTIGRKKKITEGLSEDKIQEILSLHFLTPNTKKYEMENLFVFGWESDYLCITKSDIIYECEIKISRPDFKNDFKHKPKKHLILESKGENGNKMPDYFYYAVPDGMISIEEVPDYAGLIYVSYFPEDGYSVARIIKMAPRLKNEKTNIEGLKLQDKFYYSYREWKTCTKRAIKDNQDYRRLLSEEIEKNGGTINKPYSEIEKELKEKSQELSELENRYKALEKENSEKSLYISDLIHLLRKNNIKFD